ncbi:LacI family DNA-binding transcriptional regulator [Thermotalea metallivorans]|uniref:HTH-type transcriptional regulator MalR n=1 Tax=Thermotalea metallivorans TaxID=520762 RepID=A0A140LC35_9FIRM|nr:LacI family DNA-binding transcriptional regulator [Thermotalea metallivorans]KXG78110.1 HTH-type transcriptional regulator MalR [Thermotalea metallivorans]
MKATIKEVAKKANVSPSTVSRVIADSPRISEETKTKVRKVMKELGYHPNAIARSLVNRSTNTIGVIMPKSAHLSLANPFFPEALRGISASANAHGFYVLLSIEEDEHEKHNGIENIVRAGMVDGMIMLYSKLEDKTFNMLRDCQFPFVLVGKPVKGNRVNYVDNDNVYAACEAASYLLEKGRKNIAMITGPLDLVVSLDRLAGYKSALEAHGIAYRGELIRSVEFSRENGYKAIESIFKDGIQPDGVLVTDDLLALGAMNAIKDAGLKIPEDIAMISFNNIPTAEFLTPSLSSVDIHPFDLGYEATELLFKSLGNKNALPQARIIPTQLIIRQSC